MYRFEKFMLLCLLAGFMGVSATVGYYCGMYHAVVDTKVSFHAGIVTFELDGQAYEHVADGWVSSR